MSDFSVRITRRTEIDGKAHEETIDVETFQPKAVASASAAPDEQVQSPAGFSRLADRTPPAEEVMYVDFVKLLSDGTRLEEGSDRTDHAAVIDCSSGLMWSVESLGDPDNPDDGIAQEHCTERCKQLRLLGYDDWRLPTRAELVRLIDDTRREPAIDTGIFPKVKPRWHWTSTAVAGSSASAWGVGFGLGGVGGLHRSYDGFALAVRRVGQ